MLEPKWLGLPYLNSPIIKIRNKRKELVPSTKQAFCFSSSSKIEKFLNHFKDTHSLSGPLAVLRLSDKNPILGRFVCFSTGIATVTLEDQDSSRVTELLGEYGSHIWFCTISIDKGIFTAPRHILRVFEWLKLMPNLKHFTWKSNFGGKDSLETEQYIFPYMKNLKRVVLETLPKEIKRLVLLSNYHIDTLSTKMLIPESVKLSNLKELSLSIGSDDEFKMFEMLKQHWPLLESLTLFLLMDNSGITWRRAMKVLERWKNTLTHVSILLPSPPNHLHNRSIFNADYDFKRLPYRLDLPRVKYLKLDLNFGSLNRDASLDFIFPLRESLEYLHLEYKSGYEYTRHFCSNFSSKSWILPNNKKMPFYFGYKSNIWNNFLKLKKVYAIRYLDHPGSFYYVPHTYSRYWWCFQSQSKKRVLRPTRSFELGKWNYREFFPRHYVTVKNTNHVNRAFEMAVTDLFRAWQSLNNTDVGLDRENKLKEMYLISLQKLASQGIYTSFGVYEHSNYTSNGNSEKCRLCPNAQFDANKLRAVEDHFWNTHFLYSGTYKCDFMGCEEMFPSKYDVVKHRKTHGKRHKKLYYDLEALPVHNLSLPEMAQIFNWIHVDAPQGFLKSGCWP